MPARGAQTRSLTARMPCGTCSMACGRPWRRPGSEHTSFLERRGAPVAEMMLGRADPRPGERVLELAVGQAAWAWPLPSGSRPWAR